MRFRQFAESITFSRGEAEAKNSADESLEVLMVNQLDVIYKELPLQCKNSLIFEGYMSNLRHHTYYSVTLSISLATGRVLFRIDFELCDHRDSYLYGRL